MLMTLEGKRCVLEVAGYRFERYKFGEGFEVYDSDGRPVENLQDNTMESCINDAWRDFTGQ